MLSLKYVICAFFQFPVKEILKEEGAQQKMNAMGQEVTPFFIYIFSEHNRKNRLAKP